MQHTIHADYKRREIYVDTNRVRQAFEELEKDKIIHWYMRIDGALTRDFLTTIAVGFGPENKFAGFQFIGSENCNGNIQHTGRLGVMESFNFGFDCSRSFVRSAVQRCLTERKNETKPIPDSSIQPSFINIKEIQQALEGLKNIGKINWYKRIDGLLTQDLFVTFATSIGKDDKISCFQFVGSQNSSREIKIFDRSGAMQSFTISYNCLSPYIQHELEHWIDQKIEGWDFEENCINRLDTIFKKLYAEDNSFPFPGAIRATISDDVNHAIDCWIDSNIGMIPLQIKYTAQKLLEHNEKHPEIPGWQYDIHFSDEEIVSQIRKIYRKYRLENFKD